MKLTGHYQNGYVTHDLDRALAMLAQRYGIAGLGSYDCDVEITTPRGRERMALRIAAGWTGNLNIEIVQPVSGAVDAFAAMLPADPRDFSLRLHHVALRRDDLAAMQAEIAGCGLPMAVTGQSEAMTFAYLDARDRLGHFLELVWKAPGGWEAMGWPDGRPV